MKKLKIDVMLMGGVNFIRPLYINITLSSW